MVKDYIYERCLTLAKFIIENKATVRSAAKEFGVSKSTVHKDISERLKHLSPTKAQLAKELLKINKEERHIRGGNATKTKYMNIKKKA